MSAIGLVTIRRRKGRIAGFAKPNVPVEILWCGTNRPRKKYGERKNGWSFPPAVRELLLQETQGLTVLHLFGGRADFGLRMDIDPSTKPHVVADAYLPPFPRDSFDVVILDPPYSLMRQQEKRALMWAAGWLARRAVYWFHSVWIAVDRSMPLERAWLVRVGDQCCARVLQKFGVREPKHKPLGPGEFQRGYALRYNRWVSEQSNLPLELDLQGGGKIPRRCRASKQARRLPGGLAMIAKTLDQLPKEYECRLCSKTKPIGEMVLVRLRKQKCFLLRPRCKDCHNSRERGHRREYKTKYLRRWRARNPEVNQSYWKPKLVENRETNRIRAALRLANPLTHQAVLIQGRLRRRLDMHVSLDEAKKLCRKYGPCYPTRYGLTPAGLKECERIRSRSRRSKKPLTALEIRMMVYEDGFYITPRCQKLPYQRAAQQLRRYWQQRKAAA